MITALGSPSLMENELKASRAVRLPENLCAAAEKLMKETRFATLEEFLAFVLAEFAARDTSQTDERERKLIEERLRDLGYL